MYALVIGLSGRMSAAEIAVAPRHLFWENVSLIYNLTMREQKKK